MTDASADFERLIVADAQTWARETAQELRADRRAAAGGWPKTLSEARVRVSALVATHRVPLTLEAHDRLARTAYAAARRAWASQADAESE